MWRVNIYVGQRAEETVLRDIAEGQALRDGNLPVKCGRLPSDDGRGL